MNIKKIDNKILEIKSQVNYFVENSDYKEKNIHQIRTSTREVLSLLEDKNLKSIDLKRILKFSNKIRDIDVLLCEFLVKLPNKYKLKINLSLIKDLLQNQREDEIKNLLIYLKYFSIMKVKFLELNQIDNFANKPKLLSLLNIRELHKYRIYIKKQLYISKNKKVKNNKRINLLTKIKDTLGNINDNDNALNIIKEICSKESDMKGLIQYTKTQNINHFKKVKKLILSLK